MGKYIQGKGNLIDVIREFNPELTGDYLRLNSEDPDIEKKSIEFMLNYPPDSKFILRSDASCEDYFDSEKIVTFAGIFNSFDINFPKYFSTMRHRISDPHDLATYDIDLIINILERCLNQLDPEYCQIEDGKKKIKTMIEESSEFSSDLDYLKRLDENSSGLSFVDENQWHFNLKELIDVAFYIRKYSDFRGVDISDSKMNFILHKEYDGPNILIAEHPNIEGLIHIEDFNPSTNVWTVENVYQDGLKNLPNYYKKLVTEYNNLIQKSRSENKLDPSLVYVTEGRIESEKLVQLRPYFRKNFVKNHNPRILGTIPEKGIEFKWDSNTDRYCGLDTVICLSNLREGIYDLPRDIQRGEPISLLLVRQGNYSNYLCHTGLQNLEFLTTLDDSQTAMDSFRKVHRNKVIRYFQKPDGTRIFKTVKS